MAVSRCAHHCEAPARGGQQRFKFPEGLCDPSDVPDAVFRPAAFPGRQITAIHVDQGNSRLTGVGDEAPHIGGRFPDRCIGEAVERAPVKADNGDAAFPGLGAENPGTDRVERRLGKAGDHHQLQLRVPRL